MILVHAEPGGDGLRFSNEVADWILARLEAPSPSKPGPNDSVTSKL